MVAITSDIYTREDADFMCKNSVLQKDRIIGVKTGSCPHTAIREDASMNLKAIEDIVSRHSQIYILLIESGGDTLSVTFRP